MEWERILKDAVKDNSIKELHLSKVPSLKTCEDWKQVTEVGLINHKTKYAHYKGALVRYGDRLYYVTEQRLEAISPYRSWNFKKTIKVTEIQS